MVGGWHVWAAVEREREKEKEREGEREKERKLVGGREDARGGVNAR